MFSIMVLLYSLIVSICLCSPRPIREPMKTPVHILGRRDTQKRHLQRLFEKKYLYFRYVTRVVQKLRTPALKVCVSLRISVGSRWLVHIR